MDSGAIINIAAHRWGNYGFGDITFVAPIFG